MATSGAPATECSTIGAQSTGISIDSTVTTAAQSDSPFTSVPTSSFFLSSNGIATGISVMNSTYASIPSISGIGYGRIDPAFANFQSTLPPPPNFGSVSDVSSEPLPPVTHHDLISPIQAKDPLLIRDGPLTRLQRKKRDEALSTLVMQAFDDAHAGEVGCEKSILVIVADGCG